jgi:hypothetical protein
MIKATICAEISREKAYLKGKELGLTGDAARMFSYFSEVELAIEVDEKTGIVTKVEGREA